MGNGIAKTQIGNLFVSTVQIGLDIFYMQIIPFETMVFACNDAGEITNWDELYCRRYSTFSDAIDGHNEIVEGIKNETLVLNNSGDDDGDAYERLMDYITGDPDDDDGDEW